MDGEKTTAETLMEKKPYGATLKIQKRDGSIVTQSLNISLMVQKSAQERNAKDTPECKTRQRVENNAKHGINKLLISINITERLQGIFVETQIQIKEELFGVILLTLKQDGNTAIQFLKIWLMV